ncbi:MAG: hypothetical protein ABIN92_03285 [Ferruginibacter sp.]
MALHFTAGDGLPYILVDQQDDKQSVYKLLPEPSFHLLMNGDVKVKINSTETIKVINPGITEWKRTGVEKPIYILTRPDNYIALIADQLDQNELNLYLQNHCHFN